VIFGIFAVLAVIGSLLGDDSDSTSGHSEGRGTTTEAAEAPEAPPPAPTEPKWYEGGTLHDATASEWVSATEKNRVATGADFVAAILMKNGSTSLEAAYDAGVEEDGHDYGMKLATLALVVCLNEATDDMPEEMESGKISEMAAACVLLMDANMQ
jgi:hypothetical protein